MLLTAPEKYSDFHDQLITEKGPVDGAKALAVAEGLGIDPAVLKAKANTDEVKANITEVRGLAGRLGVLTGTPSYATAGWSSASAGDGARATPFGQGTARPAPRRR